MKLRRVDIRETVGRFLYGARLSEVARKALSVLRLFLAGIRHMGRDIYQANNRWICARFRNYGSSIAVSDQNTRPILQGENALCRHHIFLKGRLRLLDGTYLVTVLGENVVNAFPT